MPSLANDGGGGGRGCSLIVDKVDVEALASEGGGATGGGAAPAMYTTSSSSSKLGAHRKTNGSGILGIWDADAE